MHHWCGEYGDLRGALGHRFAVCGVGGGSRRQILCLDWGPAWMQTMQALCCLTQILSAASDNEIALSLFNTALDGFIFMDVHSWRADCIVQIADILSNCGEVLKAVEFSKIARPLFEQSSQMKDIIKIDAKLAEVDSAVLVEYEGP
ncbi:hypothetical protein C8J57DRAFT_1238201 [Mycena rebaudengoi]|nr:hypothetical protein C8J57DRAFT_1238201 [Mycena rebaudengoi]